MLIGHHHYFNVGQGLHDLMKDLTTSVGASGNACSNVITHIVLRVLLSMHQGID